MVRRYDDAPRGYYEHPYEHQRQRPHKGRKVLGALALGVLAYYGHAWYTQPQTNAAAIKGVSTAPYEAPTKPTTATTVRPAAHPSTTMPKAPVTTKPKAEVSKASPPQTFLTIRHNGMDVDFWLPADKLTHPAVVFAEGFDQTPPAYLPIIGPIVAAGFIVEAPAFPADNTESGAGALTVKAEQLADAMSLLNAPQLNHRVNLSKLALIGHSDGGPIAAEVACTPGINTLYKASAVVLMSGYPGYNASDARNCPPLMLTHGINDRNGNDPTYPFINLHSAIKYRVDTDSTHDVELSRANNTAVIAFIGYELGIQKITVVTAISQWNIGHPALVDQIALQARSG